MTPTTRLLKATCKHGYTVRVTKRWVLEGLPRCPLGHPLKLDGEDNAVQQAVFAASDAAKDKQHVLHKLESRVNW